MGVALEIEAKYLGIDVNETRQHLKEAGFKCLKQRMLMRRRTYLMFDKNGNEIKEAWGRVRDEGDKITMTVKHVLESTVDGVKEAEVVVDSYEQASLLFGMLGYFPAAYQETKREKWQKDDVEVMLDTWPGIPPFCEVEAQSVASVNAAAAALGFDVSEGVSGCVDVLYEKYLAIPPNDINKMARIEFSNPPQSRL